MYFHDLDGHRLEVAAWTADPSDMRRLGAFATEMLDEWSRTKRSPRQAAWIHEREIATRQP